MFIEPFLRERSGCGSCRERQLPQPALSRRNGSINISLLTERGSVSLRFFRGYLNIYCSVASRTNSAKESSVLTTRERWPLPVRSSASSTLLGENNRVVPSLASISHSPDITTNKLRDGDTCQSPVQPDGPARKAVSDAGKLSESPSGGVGGAKSIKASSDSQSSKCDSPFSSENNLVYVAFI